MQSSGHGQSRPGCVKGVDLGIPDGEPVLVRSRRGEIHLSARVTDTARVGVVFATFHSARHLINLVTNDVYDPDSRQPKFKLCAVTVERVEERVAAMGRQ